MRIGLTVAPDLVNKRTLDAAVEAATEVAQAEIEHGIVPPLSQAIDSGIRWKPEDGPPGSESFDPPSTVLARGSGDCDDLAPWWAAELRASDEDPGAYAEVYQSGPKRFHVVVRRSDGSVDDPSKWAGMGASVNGIAPAARRPLASKRGSPLVVGFAHGPRGLVRARLDVPVAGEVGGVHVERVGFDTIDALDRACRAAGVLALWGAPDEVLARLAACASAINTPGVSGASWDEYVGAIQASIDPGQASNIAMTLLDPFGLRNLIAPAASSLLQQYTQSTQQQKGKNAVTSGIGASGRSKSNARSSSSRRQSSRSSSPSMQSDAQQQPFWDPSTGLMYDPNAGQWFDPNTGYAVDPTTGQPYGYYNGQGYQQPFALPSTYSPQAAAWANPYAQANDPYYEPYSQSGPTFNPLTAWSQYSYGQPYGYQPQAYSYGR